MSSLPMHAVAQSDAWETVDDDNDFDPARRRGNLRLLRGGVSADASPAADARPATPTGADIRVQFEVLAAELAADAEGVSNTRRLLRYPAYTEILALGDQAIPLLLDRLARPGARPLWLALLGSLTSFQPGAGRETIEEAAADWIRWGKRRHRPM